MYEKRAGLAKVYVTSLYWALSMVMKSPWLPPQSTVSGGTNLSGVNTASLGGGDSKVNRLGGDSGGWYIGGVKMKTEGGASGSSGSGVSKVNGTPGLVGKGGVDV